MPHFSGTDGPNTHRHVHYYYYIAAVPHNAESRVDTQTALTTERLIDKDSLKLLTQSEKRHVPTGKQSGEGEGLRDTESSAL